MRRALVLGGGGVLGAAWTVGALSALEETAGFDPRDAEAVVGTSAGAVLAALLAAGASPGSLLEHQLGLQVTEGPLSGLDFDYERATGGSLPPLPRVGLGSRQLALATLRHPRQVPTLAKIAALLPAGRGSLDVIAKTVSAVAPDWPEHPDLWTVVMDYDTARRVVLRRDGTPATTPATAVVASCAIPGWYAPVVIGGRRYVDGGAYSNTNADLLARLKLDEVYVLAPMATFAAVRPPSFGARLLWRWRRFATRQLLREVALLRAAGTRVRMLCPGPADLAAMGPNLMDPRERMRVLETSLETTAAALRDVDARAHPLESSSCASTSLRRSRRSPMSWRGATWVGRPTRRLR